MAVDRWITGIVGACVVLTMLYYNMWHVLVSVIGVALFWECFQSFSSAWLRSISLTYTAVALVCLWDAPWVLLPLAWINDTGAYLVGRWLGGPRLCPKVSPGKTWSGLIGGVTCGVLGIYALGACFPSFATSRWPIGLWIILSFAGHLGDLLESWAKRRAGIKDTASYLPGHGGFLDRCDSILGMGLVYAAWKALFF